MITTKTFKVLRDNDTKCDTMTINAFIDDIGDYGALLIAWHEYDGGILLQTDFIEMDFADLQSFIRDYSNVSAQNYVDRFKP